MRLRSTRITLLAGIISAATAVLSAGQSNPAATAPATDSAQATASIASQATAPTAAQASAPADPEYSTFFYTNDKLKLEGYFYKPAGAGPFPVVVYNHGSRAGSERRELPMVYIARVMIPAGYAVIVPERRGYGKSEGQPFSEEIGEDRGPRFVTRLQAEAGDVLGAVSMQRQIFPSTRSESY